MEDRNSKNMNASLHDAYAADYDTQVQAYDCYVADVLFGLCYEFIQPGQSLLDAGTGSGLSAQLFAKASLEIYGMDFSLAMLEVCRAKGLAADLKQHDLQQVPWPYAARQFNHLVCCGVLHFIPALEDIFREVGRVLSPGGVFGFTTRFPTAAETGQPEVQPYERQTVGDFEIFSHTPGYLETLFAQNAFTRLKMQKCFVGDDLFMLWVVRYAGIIGG